MTDNTKSENTMPKKQNVESNSIEELEIEINFNYEFADEKLTQTPRKYNFNLISPRNKTLKCNFCPSTYDDENDLQKHVKEAHEEIQKMTDENVSIKSYSKIDENNKSFECIHCKEVFFTSKHLHEHQKSHSDPITCKICNRSFSNKHHLKMHLKTHKTEKKYSCSECGKSFYYKYELKRHLNVHIGELNITSNFTEYMNLFKPFQSTYCEKEFFTSDQLHQPKKSTDFDERTCKICNISVSIKRDLARHFSSKKHKQNLKKDTLNNDDENDLQMHVKEAHKEIQKMTDENVTLKSNLKIDEGNKPFECIHCKEVFVSSKHLCEHKKSHHLKMHLKTHKTEKKYSCSVCGKKYITKYHLKRHLNVHTESNITCDICNKVFRREDNFRQHMNIHMGNKPFQCAYCDKAFFTSNHLYIHRRSTHFDTRTCKTRNESFSKKEDLASHFRSKKHKQNLKKDAQ